MKGILKNLILGGKLNNFAQIHYGNPVGDVSYHR